MRGSTCQVFSFKSVVYATPDFLYNKAIAYAKSKNVVDPAFVSSQNKPLALKRITGTLRDHGMLSGDLPSDYYGMLHQITTKRFFFKLFLTPLRIEAFDVFPSRIREEEDRLAQDHRERLTIRAKEIVRKRKVREVPRVGEMWMKGDLSKPERRKHEESNERIPQGTGRSHP